MMWVHKKKDDEPTMAMRSAPSTRAELPSDAELIARVARRDETALGLIYDRYGRLVYAIGLRITGDRQVTEEVVQDVFQAVWLSAAGFQLGANLPAWITGIARHRAIDATRSAGFRARAREDQLDPSWAEWTPAPVDEAEELAQRVVVRSALDALPETQRRALELAYYAGLTHAEIAERLGEPVGTIKSRLRMAVQKLREVLGGVE
jgi:RNA polymerase sigma-70 factor (ECF subfamily)